ncbi:MAG TPA: paraslipin [Planctomycetes bacterium]|nr:paraslipin [Planctomycetota bacterium]HIL36014.1 paraslipin [Planctomycetota bacterium]
MEPVVIAFVVVVLVGAALGLKIVNQSQAMVIERLGKFRRILEPGLNLIFPLIDRPRPILWRTRITNLKGIDMVREQHSRTVDMREQVFDFPKQSVITADNVVIEINGLLYYQVTDPRRAVYEINNLPNAIEKLAQTTLRNIIGELALDATLTSRDEINGKMRTVLDDATDKWGVKVNRVEVQDIDPPTTVREAMEMQMRAERERRATILEAEGIKESKILKAEGERGALIAEAEGTRQSRILIAQGESESIAVVASALEREQMNPADYLIAMKYLSTLSEIGVGSGGDKTVFLPFESSAALGSLGAMREMFKGGGA